MAEDLREKDLRKKVIGVLMGGISAERNISIKSGAAIANALNGLGYNVKQIDVTFDSLPRLKGELIDVAFIALHGRFGEDGTMQGLLELFRIPYTGSSHIASAVAMNKMLTKQILSYNNIKVTPFEMITKEEFKNYYSSHDAGNEPPLIGNEPPLIGNEPPLVVKPINEGSSIGISIVRREEDLEEALDKAFAYDDLVLIEKYIKARELQVGILGGQALGVIEIVPKNEFYDYDAKYTKEKAEHIFPAKLPEDTYEEVMRAGLKAHIALGCSGATRVDILYDENGDIYVLEVNTLPGMTEISLLPEIAKGVDIPFPVLCEQILKEAKLHVRSTVM